jgi:hypothetical protein
MYVRNFKTILMSAAACLLIAGSAWATDTGRQDVLRLSDATFTDGEWKVAVHVINDEELAGLDIPVRFGQAGDAIELVRVEFSDRVANWDFTHAQIDNEAKTVILGLISELVGTRANADLKVSAQGSASKIADLVFETEGDFQPRFETFTTKSPGHSLTFQYNDVNAPGGIQVREITPKFEVEAEFKASVLPTEFALSQNFPNPFNPSTSFSLSLPEASDYSLRIFNVAGQLVKSFDGHAEAGVHEITWHGTNNQGARVASGVYFYRAEANGFAETRKMIMLK